MTEITTMLTPIKTAKWLQSNDKYLVITHRRSDGDTIGCAGALCQGLREIGKTAYALYNDETTPRYLPFIEDYWAPDDYQPEHIVVVDTASVNLFPQNALKYKESVSLCIDHHASNQPYAEFTCLDGKLASCGEVLYDILTALPCGISPKSAVRLYVALATDTGCFSFANTTANTLRVASELIEFGARNWEVNRRLFRTKSHGRIKIECAIVSGLEFYFDGAVAIASITGDMMQTSGAVEDDLDDIASIPGSVEGVLAGITIKEIAGAQGCKISVRTSPKVSAHDICARFGGGGHRMASGCTIEGSVQEVKAALLKVLDDFFPLR